MLPVDGGVPVWHDYTGSRRASKLRGAQRRPSRVPVVAAPRLGVEFFAAATKEQGRHDD